MAVQPLREAYQLGWRVKVAEASMDVIIYHNPDCGTSLNMLGLISNAGIEAHIVEYLKTPPPRALLKQLIERMGISVRALLRKKGTPYDELGLDNASLTNSSFSMR
jgi:arsenate reductase (glutaredoxin)